MHNKRSSTDGFTLLEMAVVVVIIGLLIGGLFMTHAMKRSSQLQTMLAEYDSYIKGINEFKDKFLALPGDMNNAETMWGSDAACPATPSNTIPKKATCNGDGNGRIGSSTTAAVLSSSEEWFRAWQQLGNSGFIKGTFPGTPGSGSVTEAVPGTNVPASVVDGSGWTMMYYLQTADSADLWGDQYGHILHLGGFVSTSYARAAVLSANDALSLDQKIDDGKPGRGIIRAWRTNLMPGCTTNDTAQDAQTYNQANDTATTCSLFFIMGM